MNIKRSLKLHHAYHCMRRSQLANSIAAFVFCEYSRPQTALEKANYYISGCCDRRTRISFLKLTQRHVIYRHFIILTTILGWFALFAFALYWNVIEECTTNIVWSSLVMLAISLTLIPWGKGFHKQINEYKSISTKYSFCLLDTDLRPIGKELS